MQVNYVLFNVNTNVESFERMCTNYFVERSIIDKKESQINGTISKSYRNTPYCTKSWVDQTSVYDNFTRGICRLQEQYFYQTQGNYIHYGSFIQQSSTFLAVSISLYSSWSMRAIIFKMFIIFHNGASSSGGFALSRGLRSFHPFADSTITILPNERHISALESCLLSFHSGTSFRE